MSQPTPPRFAQEASTKRWRERRLRALDLALMVAVLVIAVQVRTAWQDATIVADWPWFVHSANSIALGDRAPFLQLLYSSVPCAVFAGLIRLVPHPDRLLWAWAALGACTAPIGYLAVRRLAGPAAGLGAGLILALSSGDASVVEGIKSPYVISTLTALAALGLVGATQRRPWGPPLLVFGVAMAVAFHVGLFPLVVPVCALAAVHLARLPRTQALISGLACLLLGGVVLGWVLALDLDHLLGDLAFYQSSYPSAAPPGLLDRARWLLGLLEAQQLALAGWPGLIPGLDDMYLQGMASTPITLQVAAGVSWLGIVVLSIRGLVAWRARRGGAPGSHAARGQLQAGAVGLQAWLLLLCGSFVYLKNGWQFDYLQYHHFVSLPPLALTALAGLGVAVLPSRPRWLPALVPTVAIGAWLVLARDAPLHPLPRPPVQLAPRTPVVRSARTANLVSHLVRTDAKARQHQPGVVLWGPWGDSAEPWLMAALINAQARLAWAPDDLPPACYLVTTPTLAARVETGRRLLEQPEGLVLIALDSCDELHQLQPLICARSGARRWRDDDVGDPMPETAFLEDLLDCSLLPAP